MVPCLKTTIEHVLLLKIDPPQDIDRMEIDPAGVEELALSIKEVGLLQAILVRPAGDRYEVILGHRRYLAHRKLGMDTIKAEVRKMSDKEAALARATENLAREDLDPLEEAMTYERLHVKHGMSYEEIGKRMGKKAATVKRRMDICKMPPAIQEALHFKRISITVAEELWPIRDLASLDYYLSFAVENGCTKDVARGWAKDWKDTARRNESAERLSVGVDSPYEPRPIYIPCDLCDSPMELGKDHQLRLCDSCHQTIKQNM